MFGLLHDTKKNNNILFPITSMRLLQPSLRIKVYKVGAQLREFRNQGD